MFGFGHPLSMKVLKYLQIEEIVLLGISLFLIILLYLLGFFSSNIELIFQKGWTNITPALQLWMGGAIFFVFFALLAYPLIAVKDFRKSFLDYLRKERIKNFTRSLSLFKTFTIIITITTLGILATGVLQQETKNRLLNLQLLGADKFIVKDYPLLWLHSPANALNGLFHFLTPAIIYSFLSMAGVMGLLAFIFYFGKNKNIFKGYVMSIAIAFALAMPFWFFFPANSPANYLLHSPKQNFSADLSQAISQYRPNAKVKEFQEKMWLAQKNAQPITTMPSMHWAWSIIIVYYLFKKARKTIVFSSTWLVFDLFGTIYLGNHYLIDGLAAVPLAIISIFLASLFIKLEKNYII